MLGRERLDRECVDFVAHLILENRIDKALGFEPTEPVETFGDDRGPKVAASGLCPRMPGMQVALVHDFEVRRSQIPGQFLLDSLFSAGHPLTRNPNRKVSPEASSAIENPAQSFGRPKMRSAMMFF